MGLTNNEILKFGVDTLTFIIEGLNKIIDATSGINGVAKSITSLGVAIAGLKLGKSLLTKGFEGVFGMAGGYTETRTKNPDGSFTVIRQPMKKG
jgi:hypothetical protein